MAIPKKSKETMPPPQRVPPHSRCWFSPPQIPLGINIEINTQSVSNKTQRQRSEQEKYLRERFPHGKGNTKRTDSRTKAVSKPLPAPKYKNTAIIAGGTSCNNNLERREFNAYSTAAIKAKRWLFVFLSPYQNPFSLICYPYYTEKKRNV